MKLKFIVGIVGYTLLGLSTSFQLSETALAGPTPRTCASRKSPTKGAPTFAQAKAYFICGMERYNNNAAIGIPDSVSIVRNIKMEMSPKPIFVNAANVGNVRETISSSSENITVDVNKPLYAIRGSFASYACGRTCKETIIVGAKGFCFVDDFSDWHCKMKGNFGADPRNNVPIPANE